MIRQIRPKQREPHNAVDDRREKVPGHRHFGEWNVTTFECPIILTPILTCFSRKNSAVLRDASTNHGILRHARKSASGIVKLPG